MSRVVNTSVRRLRTTLQDRLERTRLVCREALERPPLAGVQACIAKYGGMDEQLMDAVRATASAKQPAAAFTAIRDLVNEELKLPAEMAAFERLALIRTALAHIEKIPLLPVDESVQHLFCRDIVYYATPPDSDTSSFTVRSANYYSRLRVALLQRFPAGQSDWEVSGFPRRWLAKIAPAHVPRALLFIATKLRGFSPLFVGHLSAGRLSPFLLEQNFRLGFYRSALALEKQPEVRGLMAASWLHSRETHRVSPHLAFLNRAFTEAGGLYIDLGPASPRDGFTAGDPHRSELYSRGEYKPTFAAVMCTREQVIRWKENNRHLEPLLNPRC